MTHGQLFDPDCDQALAKFEGALYQSRENAGREYTLILIPVSPDEEVHMSVNGTPISAHVGLSPEGVLKYALKQRNS